jgi:hypothetical protein
MAPVTHDARARTPADVVSARLDALVLDPTERTYLGAIDGYWADTHCL